MWRRKPFTLQDDQALLTRKVTKVNTQKIFLILCSLVESAQATIVDVIPRQVFSVMLSPAVIVASWPVCCGRPARHGSRR
eukprot:5185009-Pleurochrysis_carterae.AAC.4